GDERQGHADGCARRPAVPHAVSARPGAGALSARRLGPAEGVRPLPRRDNPRPDMTRSGADLPQDRIFAFAHADLRVRPGPHPCEAGNADAIEANWALERQRNPALFDGRVILFAG